MNGLSTNEDLAVFLFMYTDFPLQQDNQNSKSEPARYLFISFSHPANSSLNTPTALSLSWCNSTRASKVMSFAINCVLLGFKVSGYSSLSFFDNDW